MTVSEIQFQSLVQNSFDVFSIIDPDGNYIYNSNSITRILGYTPDELVGKNAFLFVHPDDLERLKGQLAILYSKPFINDMLPFRFKNEKGSWTWLESTGTNMLNDPSIKGLVIYSRDVTEKIEIQERMANYQREITSAAIEAQERERTQLSLELHDNVNPVLSTVKLYLEMFMIKQESDLEPIHKSVKYIQDCINEIRSISIRLSAPSLSEISFKESVRELVDSINLTGRVKINLKITAIEENKISQEIHTTVYRLIQEQINNILQHSQAKKAWITISKTKNALVLTVKDNGKGFEVSEKSKGIGLMSIQSRVETLKGKLSVESSDGHGCVLKAIIPVTGN
jgi:PAS domain S-box-containing protein